MYGDTTVSNIYWNRTQMPEIVISATTLSFMIFEIISAVVITFGNSLTIISLLKFERLQTITNRFIGSLAMADLLTGIFLFYHCFYHPMKVLGFRQYSCLGRFVFVIQTVSASMISLLLVSTDRFLAVLYPLHHANIMTPRKCNIFIILTWVYATAQSLLLLVWNRWYKGVECDLAKVVQFLYFACLLTPMFGIVATAICFMYTRMFREAARHRKRIQNLHVPDAVGRTGGDANLDSNAAKRKQNDRKSAKTVVIVVGLFALCWLPFFTFMFLELFLHMTSTSYILHYSFSNMGFINSALNPLVYSWRNKDFNHVFRTLLRLKVRPSVEESRMATNSIN